jgi:hypothetical protein
LIIHKLKDLSDISNTELSFQFGNFASFGLDPLNSDGTGLAKGFEVSLQKKLSDTPYYGILSLTYRTLLHWTKLKESAITRWFSATLAAAQNKRRMEVT